MPRSRMTTVAIATALVLATAAALDAHDMFLKLPSFFLAPHAKVEIALLNGTFEDSENPIARERMADVSLVGPDGNVAHPPASAWTDRAVYHSNPDSVDTSFLAFETGDPGTYVLGVSTRATVFELGAEDFNAYLEHDGVVDILAARREQDRLGEAAVERYSKHVKAILQVGDRTGGSFEQALGYPAELVPLRNPYELAAGETLEVRFLRAGAPVPDHPVYASYEGHHGHDEAGAHIEAVSMRTDADGVARIPLEAAGRWYVRTIHMVETTDEPDVDYESNWATLTFEIR